MFTSLEICAGCGGQALGLRAAGFEHLALVEIDPNAAETLRRNTAAWDEDVVVLGPPVGTRVPDGGPWDVRNFDATPYAEVDLLAGGVPCPPFSAAGKQLGRNDERDLFWRALDIAEECDPKAIMLENVRGIMSPKFRTYREEIRERLGLMGYGEVHWDVLNASDYGVPQLRPRAILVALRDDVRGTFEWPEPQAAAPPTVGETLLATMSEHRWRGAVKWAERADRIAPTLVGGSKKHGGADLGPTRARVAWAQLGVDGRGLWDNAPEKDFVGMPRLTVPMAAKIQGFPGQEQWPIYGRKTASYRQVGNAFPPPVAEAVGERIHAALAGETRVMRLASAEAAA